MPPNSRKPQPNLSKPSEGQSFNAERKVTSEQTNPLRSGLNLKAERELGAIGGVKSTATLTVGVDNLIGQQGVAVEIDATNRTAGFGAGIGSTKGKLGVNIGGKIGYDEEGNIIIKGAEAGINIGGFGGSASIDEDEGIRGSISVAGAKVEVGVDPNGKKTLSLCYGVPGGELCITFEPDPGTPLPPPIPPPPTPTPTPMPTPGPGIMPSLPSVPVFPTGTKDFCKVVVDYHELHYSNHGDFEKAEDKFYNLPYRPQVNQGYNLEYKSICLGKYDKDFKLTGTVSTTKASHTWVSNINYDNKESKTEYSIIPPDPNPGRVGGYGKIEVRSIGGFCYEIKGAEQDIYAYIKKNSGGQAFNTVRPESGIWEFDNWVDFKSYTISLNLCVISPPTVDSPLLPNYPQHFKPMCNCCDEIKEIHKYLGIAKLKKNKFPVSNAFLVPGGKGNDNCFDYYAIMQALFRMLANGLIINPKSKPLGSDWQSTNATAWASNIYEMLAESMSDGNSTQRFEVAAIVQLTQMMSVLAENSRKIEFVADSIGIEPMLVSEELPVCFTVYENHKGFGKKEPKKINVSTLKTDSDVEKTLGKMLNPSLVPITAWKFKPGQISIREALNNG